MDEAYTEFIESEAPNLLPLIEKGLPIICCRTFSKIYGLAGLRVGYAISRPESLA
jgi:histidinol-phosphate aminotransferase